MDSTIQLKLLESRNLTTHTYREDVARPVYADVRGGFPTLQSDFTRLQAHLQAKQQGGERL